MISRIAISTVKRATYSSRNFSAAWSGDLSFSSPESDFLLHAVPRSDHIEQHHTWTQSLSFASPESDFKSSFEAHHLPTSVSEWSSELSFASPEADFTFLPTVPDAEWSQHYSFASPESDFKSHLLTISQQTQVYDEIVARHSILAQEEIDSDDPVWSGNLSFSSPESDFLVNAGPRSDYVEEETWSQTMSHASPESDFMSSSEVHHLPTPATEWSQGLSFTSPEADVTCHPNAPDVEWNANYSFATPEADFHTLSLPQQQAQRHDNFLSDHPLYHRSIPHPESALGEISVHHLMASLPLDPLPLSIDEAMRDTRAVVITSPDKPFEIVDVNDAWVGLCGYKRAEALHGSLKMLQGQATNQSALDALIQGLQVGREGQTIVTNYKKSGQTFLNHVRAGVIRDAQTQKVTHFVGVLQEVVDQQYHMTT